MGEKRVLALDPGYRTGAKLVCLDGQGTLLQATTIYPTQSERKQAEAARTVIDLVRHHGIEAIAIGNGTAGRETEDFVRALDLPKDLIITLVNEDGASIYSASEVARREFPGSRHYRAGGSVHRQETAGSPGGTGEDRPEIHRSWPVSI